MKRQPGCCAAVREYAKTSTIPGFSHWHQSQQSRRRFIWLIFSLALISFCCYHIFYVVRNFVNSPISSSFTKDGTPTVFPDVTLCNRRSMPETAIAMYKQELYDKLQNDWGFFDNGLWLENHYRLATRIWLSKSRKLFASLLATWRDIFWTSEDTKNFGYPLSHILPYCRYNGMRCRARDFTLIQSSRHWNCYTFSPSDKTVYSTDKSSGLELLIFTDSVLNRTIEDELSFHDKIGDNGRKPILLKTVLDDPERSEAFMRTKPVSDLGSSGMEIYVHDHNHYPFCSEQSFIVNNGQELRLQVSQIEYELLSHNENPCTDEEMTADYVVSFGRNGSDMKTGKFTMGLRDIQNHFQNRFLYSECGCYSNRYPFTDVKKLCNFLPEEHWVNGSDEFMQRLACTVNAFKTESQIPFTKSEEILELMPCKQRTYEVSESTFNHLSDDDLVQFIDSVVTQLTPRQLRFFIKEDKDIMKRYKIIYDSLLDQKCKKTNKTMGIEEFWCSSAQRIKNNFVKVTVHPRQVVGSVYKEFMSYQWPEVLSEIGGTLGLWLGMSILIVAELLELLASCVCPVHEEKDCDNVVEDGDAGIPLQEEHTGKKEDA